MWGGVGRSVVPKRDAVEAQPRGGAGGGEWRCARGRAHARQPAQQREELPHVCGGLPGDMGRHGET